MSKVFVGNVKSVLSGDTLILTSPNNPSAERNFSLAYVTAPHLRREGDEPFAFQSREYLRNLVVGKPIQCTIQYTIPNSGREFGTAKLKDGGELPDELVKAGWLKVREDAGRKEENEEVLERLEKLRGYESEAKAEGKGLWAGTGGVIEVQNDLGGPEFMKEWKGKTVDGVVERVLSGDRLLVRLLLSEKKHVQPMTLIAGIRTPATERTVPSTGTTQPAEEFGNEARQFVESRLLQRQVKVEIVGASPQGQLVASIIHPRGNIAEFLLQDGLARCNDFHSTMLGEKMAALRSAEKQAQSKKLRLHKHHVAKAVGDNQEMTVSKIVGADTIFVKNKAGAEKRISFSSIRGPRTNEASESPFREEAKEFLRQKLIGKHVKISIDGKKPASEGFEAKEVATVTEKGKNIALMLVEAGWASVIRHRKDDTDRASNYDELLAAQEKAKEELKGMWSGKPQKAKQYTDLSENAQKAKIMLATLQRQKKVPAIVDFCKAGSRFTVLIPRENVKLTMVLGGIRAPRAPRADGEGGEPFGKEALDLANRRCNQRDCEVDIHDMDKVGGFIGALYINRENFAKILVEEGLASVHAYSAEKSGNSTELFAAEKKAKEARKGLWHDYDPSQEEADEEEETTEETPAESEVSLDKKPTDYRDVMITNIDGNGKIKIQEIGKGTAALETMMNEFRKFHLDSKNNKPLGDAPKTGDFVSAKFSADGQWYRARVRSNDRTAKVAEVQYVDYGNTEKIPWSDLRGLDHGQFGIQKLKAQAIDASLSFVQLPTGADYFNEAIGVIAEMTEGKRLVGSFDIVDTKENVSYITLYDPKSNNELPGLNDSINKEVVASGYGMVPKKLKAWERSKAFESYLKHLKEVESQAKQDRLGMWEYGDITED
ncbi:nuclease and tudor domain protein [Metarhizium robertsii]|uniref:Probable endonuclease LCL3 n=2 Tax=Metarhizium robertsii TaxID=568076 RepID=E9EJ77_METRA|nr:nuclease (SNase-like) [Metarhizium robertsii ARSEF 23]EFZ03763.1 nuclease (SNase-like) [Metarhizium robertsii ARSEF 23]EXV02139.1 nuclease and tudor domain protein [Metarhizium robertsii]